MDFSHVVVGGGVVGLSIASRLLLSPISSSSSSLARSVLLLDRHPRVGMETSSRNSEVIHAGLYYPPQSLKTSLCLRGKELLYPYLEKHNIDHRRCGKWIVAQDEEQVEYLKKMRDKANTLGVPVHFIGSREEARRREPHIRVGACALESSSTGILDSHGLMRQLSDRFLEGGGDLVVGTEVQRIEKVSGGYKITTRSVSSTTRKNHGPTATTEETAGEGEAGGTKMTGLKEAEETGDEFEVTTESVINAAGLFAVDVANMILPQANRLKGYFAKGQYYAYSGGPTPSRLIYPCPEPNLAGLGTHLTFDLAGAVRFGPDVEWVDNPMDYSTSDARLEQVYDAVRQFYPSLRREGLRVDYCGIRPKVAGQGAGASDFVIRHEEATGLPGFVNLLGMESPGLTSCLAIAEHVEEMLK